MIVTHEYERDSYGIILLFRITELDTGNPKDISGLDVQFKMWESQDSSLKIDAPCTIYDGSNGECTYKVKEEDFNDNGTYESELQLSKIGYLETTETFKIIIYDFQSVPVNYYEYTGDVWTTMSISGSYQQL